MLKENYKKIAISRIGKTEKLKEGDGDKDIAFEYIPPNFTPQKMILFANISTYNLVGSKFVRVAIDTSTLKKTWVQVNVDGNIVTYYIDTFTENKITMKLDVVSSGWDMTIAFEAEEVIFIE